MIRRNFTAACAAGLACAAIALGSGATVARGAEKDSSSPANSMSYADNIALANRAMYMADEPPVEGLLQTTLREQGWGGSTLSQYDLRVGGYAELGYSYNFMQVPGGDNGFGRVFDDKAYDPRIDQISLWMRRDVPISPNQFDMGFVVQVIYGSDVRFFQANGTNFYGPNFGTSPIQRYPDEQIDFTQAHLLMNVPWGNGLLVTLGKFVTPWGLEHIDPTQNALYSHSLMFAVAQPQTLTGVMAKYPIDDKLWVNGGIVLGWDQALEDNNDFPSILGQVGYNYEGWDLVLSALVGPERTSNRSDYRWTLNGTAKYQIDLNWSVGFEAVVGYEPDIGTEFRDVQVDQFGTLQRQFLATGDDSFWFGGIIRSSYRMDDEGMWTLNVRGEYFNNSEGGRWFPSELWSLTGGITWVPFPHHEIGRNLAIRPEVRWDYSEDDIFDAGERNAQVTANVDVLFKF